MASGPNSDQARQFAVMLSVGAPPSEAIRYFLPEEEMVSPTYLAVQAELWLRSKAVQEAVRSIQGKDWTEMTAHERISLAIDKHYTEMAYFLYSRNYVDLGGADKAKADTCRAALEAKLAGTAGKLSAVEQFWSDVVAGKVKLSKSSSEGAASPMTGSIPSLPS